jgi:hypothetical protein
MNTTRESNLNDRAARLAQNLAEYVIHWRMRAFTIVVLFMTLGLSQTSIAAENLLKNPGFEHDEAWAADQAASLRNMWRSHDGGHYNAAILGLWATQGANGFVEQRDIPVEPGKTYVFKAWLWADLGWNPESQFLKVIFLDDEQQPLSEQTVDVPGIHPIWTPVKCEATAPAKAATAIVRIGALQVSAHGALTIDDLFFGEDTEEAPSPNAEPSTHAP